MTTKWLRLMVAAGVFAAVCATPFGRVAAVAQTPAAVPAAAAQDDDPVLHLVRQLELEELTGELSGKERAAVVLRYGYDLEYAEIAAALGSSPEAARQAASSGRRVRRPRVVPPWRPEAGPW